MLTLILPEDLLQQIMIEFSVAVSREQTDTLLSIENLVVMDVSVDAVGR